MSTLIYEIYENDAYYTKMAKMIWMYPSVLNGADRYEGRLKVGKVNVDEEPELAVAFQITSIPILVLMKNGQAVADVVGYHTIEQIEKKLGLTDL